MVIKKAKYAVQAIPTRFRFDGDIEKCHALKGFAKQQFARFLEIDAANKYNKHLVANRRWPTIESQYGELITIQMIRGVSVIDIFVPEFGEGKEAEWVGECFCNACFTVGKVLDIDNCITNTEIEPELEDRVACNTLIESCEDNFHGTSRETYAVKLCKNKTKLQVVTGCEVIDHALYCPGDIIALMRYPFNSDAFEILEDCLASCPGSNCGVIEPDGFTYAIAPFRVGRRFLGTL